MSLITAFETVEDLDAYRVHPEHVKVVEYFKTVTENSAAVDYDLQKYDPNEGPLDIGKIISSLVFTFMRS